MSDLMSVLIFDRRGRKGGSCAQFTAIKNSKSRITAINFRVSRFTGNNMIDESVFHKQVSTLSVFTL